MFVTFFYMLSSMEEVDFSGSRTSHNNKSNEITILCYNFHLVIVSQSAVFLSPSKLLNCTAISFPGPQM
jgi:hypothetical protein